MREFRKATTSINREIDRGWARLANKHGDIVVCVPLTCSTDSVSTGVVAIQASTASPTQAEIQLDGVLVEFETDRRVKLSKPVEIDYEVYPFSFVGKRPGRGKVFLRSEEIGDMKQAWTFDIRILPTTMELARDSLIFAVPVSGVSLLALWAIGKDPKEYAVMTAAIGGMFGLMLYGLRYMRTVRYR